MKLSKFKILKIILYLSATYYVVGAVAHFFGLTIFPFYVNALYAPYHDTVISLTAIILSMVLFAVARNPEKNIDILNVVIIGGIIAIIFSVGIIWKIDFVQLGAPAKKTQTIVEMILLVVSVGILAYLKPKYEKRR
jgi:hypothetical protein